MRRRASTLYIGLYKKIDDVAVYTKQPNNNYIKVSVMNNRMLNTGLCVAGSMRCCWAIVMVLVGCLLDSFFFQLNCG